MSARNPAVLGKWGLNGTRVIASETMWREPRKWNREARDSGQPRRVFCASLADIFEGGESMPDAAWEAVQAARGRLWTLVEDTPWLTWMLLTKRPENIMAMVPKHWQRFFPGNVWIGTSVENQEAADKRIPELLKIPAAVRFLSCEPLLGPVNLSNIATATDTKCNALLGEYAVEHSPCPLGTHDGGTEYADGGPAINWVIAGGESGPYARPMHPAWARSLRDQCKAAGVPFFFKQWGEWAPLSDETEGLGVCRWIGIDGSSELDGCEFPADVSEARCVVRVGKKAAGRLLDGVLHDEVPGVDFADPAASLDD
jgi:protein gp37